MKKSVIIAAVAAGAAVLGGGVVYASEQVAKSQAISEENACNFAYADAGVLPEEVLWKQVEFDFEDGSFVYDIDFVTAAMEYDYTVHSSNGRVLKRSSELRDGAALTAQPQEQSASPQEQSAVAQGGAQAAPQEQGAAAQEQSAAPQPQTSQTGTGSAAGDIGVEQAKTIALQHAGLTAEGVVFSKAKLDREDGRLVYEIEFYVTGKSEYEYEIDASTGEILDADREMWEPDDWDD